MWYDILFWSTDTQLTMTPYAATRCGHDTTTLSHAADGLCDPWRWLPSPVRRRLRPYVADEFEPIEATEGAMHLLNRVRAAELELRRSDAEL